MDGLIVKQPYARRIIKGHKKTEFRSTPLPKNKTGRPIFLLNTGKILGTIVFSGFQKFDGWYEWYISSAKAFPKPKDYEKKPGCVIWVTDVRILK